jgi:HEXXH motif-containing protein
LFERLTRWSEADLTMLPATPHYHVWRAKILDAVKQRHQPSLAQCASLLGGMLAVPLMRSDVAGPLDVPVFVDDLSRVYLSGSRIHLKVPHTPGPATVTIHAGRIDMEGPEGFSLRLSADELHTDRHGGLVFHHPAIGDIECDSSDPLIDSVLRRNNDQQPVGPYPQRDLSWGMDAADPARRFAAAMEVIRRWSPSDAADIEANVRLIAPFRSDHLVGFSSPLALGAVFIAERPDDPVHYVEHLLHEACHTLLFRFQLSHKLQGADPGHTVAVPWRQDGRPVIGAIHGTYVFGRLAVFFSRAREDRTLGRRFTDRYLACRDDFADAYRTLREPGLLSDQGAALLQAVVDRLDLS